MEPKTIDLLVGKVVQWAQDRNLIDGSTPERQLEKTAAELVELTIAVGKDSMVESGETFGGEIASELGDVLVTLIIVAEQLGLDVWTCLAVAYDKIKDRKGKMIDGKFVKESDL